MATELLYLRDAYLQEFTATVTEVDGPRVALDRTAFYPMGGGQPHDTGMLAATWNRSKRAWTSSSTRSPRRSRPGWRNS